MTHFVHHALAGILYWTLASFALFGIGCIFGALLAKARRADDRELSQTEARDAEIDTPSTETSGKLRAPLPRRTPTENPPRIARRPAAAGKSVQTR